MSLCDQVLVALLPAACIRAACPSCGTAGCPCEEGWDLPTPPFVEGVEEGSLDGWSSLETAIVQEILIATSHIAAGDVKHIPITVATAKDRLPYNRVEFMLTVRPLASHRIASADVMATALKHHLLAVLRSVKISKLTGSVNNVSTLI